ncbi:P-loop containing nucleoside triphosphate hydrolase [Pseudocohnilembus persalinus]|uniref:p-loop containing nucleoside triphosphate hydrolase n=1 Tax=Pseudocohnilembus persalinus TaxID=266149 RepID=A0A0V0QXE3_PSEPJ|nr:P-loop containing nucleoside triphosphate hydrolase [Pseudocohnilembus persalinus]|eukprot:KRX06584.1 P-loop containing nucleoside triphosphate hydrolase [Pseudocohnilembus persalinus]
MMKKTENFIELVNKEQNQNSQGKLEKPEDIYKIIIVGDPKTGKTSLIDSFLDRPKQFKYTPTVGLEFVKQDILFKNQKIQLHIWDTAGKEEYRTITPAHYRKVLGAIAVFDCGNMDSLRNVENWIEEVLIYNDDERLQILVVGNKEDQMGKNRQQVESKLQYLNIENEDQDQNGDIIQQQQSGQQNENKKDKIVDLQAVKLQQYINLNNGTFKYFQCDCIQKMTNIDKIMEIFSVLVQDIYDENNQNLQENINSSNNTSRCQLI